MSVAKIQMVPLTDTEIDEKTKAKITAEIEMP